MSYALLILTVLYLLLTFDSKPKPPARPLSSAEKADLRALLAGGDEVIAVRRYREWTGAGLLEAATAVEQLRQQF